MKTSKKFTSKPSIKGKGPETDNSKKQKLKPLNPKEFKNWKNKLDESDDDDELDLNEDEFGNESSTTYEDNLGEDEDRY